MCEYENFICIDWLKTIHTKRKCVLEPKLQNPLVDLVCLSFFCYFLFLEERDIKVKIKYIFTPDFNRGGLRKATGLTSGEQSVKF